MITPLDTRIAVPDSPTSGLSITRPEIEQGSTVLVTGAAGFLGSHLCRRLLRAGCAVVGLDNLSTGRLANLAQCQRSDLFSFVHADVGEPIALTGSFDYVFHLASPASPDDYRRLPLQTLIAGSSGTWNALGVAERSGARFVLASTSEVYGDPVIHPQGERYRGNVDPVGPRSAYDEAKRYAEALTTAYGRDRDVTTGIARIFNTYGPGMRENDGRAVPDFVAQALRGRPLSVTGDGTQTRSLCFVSDTIEGLVAMAAARDTAGPVNLGNPHEITVMELAVLVRDLCGSASEIRTVPPAPDDPRRRCPDIGLARRILAWSPRVGLREGLTRTIDAARRATADERSGAAAARGPR